MPGGCTHRDVKRLLLSCAALSCALAACDDAAPTPVADATVDRAEATVDALPSPDAPAPDDVRDAAVDDVRDAADASDAADVRDAADAFVNPVPDYCARYAQALCQRQFFCRLSAEEGTPCIRRETAACVARMASVADALAAGRMTFRASTSDACLLSLPEYYCITRDLLGASAACDEMFRGTVANGEVCVPGGAPVCANGYCPARVATCPARCQPFATEGSACGGDADVRCGAGLVCVAGVCRSALAEGATCDPTASTCGARMRCVTVGARSTCQTLRTSGLPCEADAQCVNGLCASGFCAGGRALNDSCSAAFECGEGLACGDIDPSPAVDRRCIAGVARDGACTADQQNCAIGLRCAANRCVPLVAYAGDPCSASECVAGLWCRRDAGASLGVCTARGAMGAACDPSNAAGSCAAPLVCGASGVCGAAAAVGEACAADGVCASRRCVDGRCAAACTAP